MELDFKGMNANICYIFCRKFLFFRPCIVINNTTGDIFYYVYFKHYGKLYITDPNDTDKGLILLDDLENNYQVIMFRELTEFRRLCH